MLKVMARLLHLVFEILDLGPRVHGFRDIMCPPSPTTDTLSKHQGILL